MSQEKNLLLRAIKVKCNKVIAHPIEINIDDYPQLTGMSDDEVKSFIQNNASQIFKTGKKKSLLDELLKQQVFYRQETDDIEIEFR